MNQRLKNSKGFTLIEALVSCVVLTGALVTLIAVNTRSMTNIRLNRQRDLAWQILDRQLTTIESMGIEEFIDQGITSGEIEESDLTYNWEIEVNSEDIDNLYQVNITVRWFNLNKFHQVSADTRFNGPTLEATMVKAN